MKRLVFTIVAGFIGGSRASDALVPQEPEGAGHERPRDAAGEPSYSSASPGVLQAESVQQDQCGDPSAQTGVAAQSTGYA